MILSLMLAAGAVAALVFGVADVVPARRGQAPVEEPIGLILLAAAFAWLAFASWPR